MLSARNTRITVVVIILALTLVVASSLPAAAATSEATRRFRWNYIHVNIDVQPDGSAIISEEQQLSFEGPYSFVNRVIPLERVDNITDIFVGDENGWYTEGIDPGYRPVSYAGYVPKGQPGRFTVERHNGEVTIAWYFTALNETRTFRLRYRAVGVVRMHKANDEIWWAAIGPDKGAEVAQASATIHLPERVATANLVANAYEDESLVRAGANVNDYGAYYEYNRPIPDDESWTVRLAFPRGIVAAVPPVPFNRYAIPLSAGIAMMVAAAVVLLRTINASRIRLEPLGRELDQPPADTPPGLVAYLLSPLGSPAGAATFLDLAQRGYFTVTRIQLGRWNWQGRTQYDIEGTGKDRSDLLPYESRLLETLVERTPFTALQLQTTLNNINQDRSLSREADRRGWFVSEHSRRMSAVPIVAGAAGTMLASIALALWAALRGPDWAVIVIVLCGMTAVAATIIQPIVGYVRRSETGARAHQQWAGFFRHLRRPAAIIAGDPERALQWLPLAVAGNLAFYWQRALRGSSVPVPSWYHSESGGVPVTELLMDDFVRDMIWVGTYSSGTGGGGVGGASGGGGGTAG